MIVNELFLKLRMEYGFNLFLPFLFFFLECDLIMWEF